MRSTTGQFLMAKDAIGSKNLLSNLTVCPSIEPKSECLVHASFDSPLVTVVRIKTNSVRYFANFMEDLVVYEHGTEVAFAVWQRREPKELGPHYARLKKPNSL
jgi:hypothetical protein